MGEEEKEEEEMGDEEGLRKDNRGEAEKTV